MRFVQPRSLAFGIAVAVVVFAPHADVLRAAAHLRSPATPRASFQAPAMSGTSVMFGTVVADATGRPITGAAVNTIVFADSGTFLKSATTDRQGRFVLSGLSAGQFHLSSGAAGYLAASFGQSGADDVHGTFIPVAEGQIIGPITLRLRRGGVISGRVLDEASEAFGGVRVQAFRRSFSTSGRRQFMPAGSAVLTNDQGDYRIANLTPGTYVVGVVPRMMEADIAALDDVGQSGSVTSDEASAFAGMSLRVQQDAAGLMPIVITGERAVELFSAGSPIPTLSSEGKSRGYAPTFFPGAPAANAAAITVNAAEEKAGVVFQLVPVVISAISGHIVAANGTSPRTTALTLVPQGNPDAQIGDTFTALAGATGEFSFSHVPEGGYVIEARSTVDAASASDDVAPAPHRSWASVPISVGETPQSELTINLHDGISFSGEMRFEGATPPPTGAALAEFAVRLAAHVVLPSLTNSAISTAPLNVDRHFSLNRALVPGDYQMMVGNNRIGGWVLASMTIDGRDITDGVLHVANQDVANVVITMTDRTTEVSGAITRLDGTADTASTIIVFPQDRALWTALTRRITSARPTSDGRYQVNDVPPGDYFVVAVLDVERGQWFDPEFLASLQAKATRITLAAGEKKTLDLRASK